MLWKFGREVDADFLYGWMASNGFSIGSFYFFLKNVVLGTVVADNWYCRHWLGCDGPASGIPNLLND